MSVNIKTAARLLPVFVISLALMGRVYSQYLLDEEHKKAAEKKAEQEAPKPLEKKKAAVKKPERGPSQLDDVDIVLRRTFFKGLFRESVKELQGIVASSGDAREASKARLFIARSYIEMGQYRKALDMLILPEVKRYFPKDASFWEAFALTRIGSR
jgi:hypothetical protein